MTEIQTFDSVWDAIADTPQQAANLRARAELMRQVAAIIKANDWTQAAAAHSGVTPPGINARCAVACRDFRWTPW